MKRRGEAPGRKTNSDQFCADIASATAAADRILATRNDEDAHNHGNVQLESSEKGAEVEFRDVWFEYPTRPGPVLKGLNLKVSLT